MTVTPDEASAVVDPEVEGIGWEEPHRHPRWMDRDTEYVIVRSGTPVDEDGFKLGEPEGVVVCLGCCRGAPSIEAISHGENCDNAE